MKSRKKGIGKREAILLIAVVIIIVTTVIIIVGKNKNVEKYIKASITEDVVDVANIEYEIMD